MEKDVFHFQLFSIFIAIIGGLPDHVFIVVLAFYEHLLLGFVVCYC